MPAPARPRRSLRGALVRAVREREIERTRVSRVLHDEVGQILSAVGLQFDVLRLDLRDKVPDIAARTTEIQNILENAVEQVRRLSHQLCPEPVERAGLASALRRLAGRRQQLTPAQVLVECSGAAVLPGGVATALYRIAEQALDNAIRHSEARRIRISLRMNGRGTTLEVRDNGCGFDPARVRRRPAGIGLMLMDSYAADFGMTLELASAPGRDTIVRASYETRADRGHPAPGRAQGA